MIKETDIDEMRDIAMEIMEDESTTFVDKMTYMEDLIYDYGYDMDELEDLLYAMI